MVKVFMDKRGGSWKSTIPRSQIPTVKRHLSRKTIWDQNKSRNAVTVESGMRKNHTAKNQLAKGSIHFKVKNSRDASMVRSGVRKHFSELLHNETQQPNDPSHHQQPITDQQHPTPLRDFPQMHRAALPCTVLRCVVLCVLWI